MDCIYRTKRKPKTVGGWMLDGKAVRRLPGMIYWYGWGRKEFDIRIMRQLLGQPKDSVHDTWFRSEPIDTEGAFKLLMAELQDALAGRSFAALMNEHDHVIKQRGKEWAKEWAKANP